MSFPGGQFGAASGPGALRFSSTRGRIQNGHSQGVHYPSPFFDIAHTYLPTTVKQMFRWCRYYFLTNPLINATVFKLSEYPITDMQIDHPNKEVSRMWMEYFNDHLDFRSFRIETGIDYFTYGNCLPSLSFPFKKYLKCASCGFQAEAKKIRPYYAYTNYQFRLTCPRCQVTGTAEARDLYLRNEGGVKLMRWSPEDMEIIYSDITGDYTYFYNIPPTVRNDVIIGKKEVVEQLPQVFPQALRQQKAVVFNKDTFFHLRRPTLADQDRGWGLPLLLPVLKDTFYMQLMKKAQEAILLEHIVPLRVLFPQAGSGTSDPYTSINLSDWRDHVATEIARWRMDPNYIPIMPLPLGNQTIGGDGRALLLTQELQAMAEHIMMGMTVPREFLLGGMSYSGSNVSMRMMENQFLVYLNRHKRMAYWIMRNVASYMRWPMASIRFKPFKMADDIQRKAYLFQLNAAGKISDETLLADADLDQGEEDKIMTREMSSRLAATEKQQIAVAELQGKQQAILMKMQAKAQQEMQNALIAPTAPGEPGGPSGGVQAPLDAMASPLGAGQDMGMVNGPQEGQQAMLGGASIHDIARHIAQQLANVDPPQQHLAIKQLRGQSPELADLVLNFLAALLGSQEQVMGQLQQQQQQQQPVPQVPNMLGAQGEAATQINMQPMPEQRPPRRAAGTV